MEALGLPSQDKVVWEEGKEEDVGGVGGGKGEDDV